jgi:uncharacterized membrane protein
MSQFYGRIFYGVSIAAIGVLTMIYRDVPYMMLPPKHTWLTEHLILVYAAGVLLLLAGTWITLGRKLVPVSLLLGTTLLLIFCFYFVPYELTVSKNVSHFGDWENSAKELALAGGAFVMAGSVWGKPARLGAALFALTIISFGIDHFLYAREAQDYIPAWIPNHLFWMYPTGAALLGSGIAILLRIRVRLFAMLLGSMIFIWVVILHVPKALAAGFAYGGGEISSLFLALAYCGTAFVIAGQTQSK